MVSGAWTAVASSLHKALAKILCPAAKLDKKQSLCMHMWHNLMQLYEVSTYAQEQLQIA